MRMLFLIIMTSLAIAPHQGTDQINKVEGIFIGRVEDGYSFCCKTEQGEEKIIVFDEILSVILEKYPLNEDKHRGENFIISFIGNIELWESDSEKKSTIIRLEKLVPGQHL